MDFSVLEAVIHDPILEATGVKKEAVHDFFGFVFIVLVTVGYHTRLSSCILIIWLGIMNFFVNDFWNTEDNRFLVFSSADVFQTIFSEFMTINDLTSSRRSPLLVG